MIAKAALVAWSAAVFCGVAGASPVVVLGSGTLGTAGGIYRSGDPFSVATRYDDAAPRVFAQPGVYAAYSSTATAPIVATVRGDPIVASVLYSMIVSANHFDIGTPGDYSPTATIKFTLDRADPLDFSLPSAAELQRASGYFSFVYRAAPGLAGSGAGAFAMQPAAVPEPGVAVLLTVGIGLLAAGRRSRGGVDRRRGASEAGP